MRLRIFRHVLVLLVVVCVVSVMIMLDRTSRTIITKHHETGHVGVDETQDEIQEEMESNETIAQPVAEEKMEEPEVPVPLVAILEPDVKCSRRNAVIAYVLTTVAARESRKLVRTTWGDVSTWNSRDDNPFTFELFFVTGVTTGEQEGSWDDQLEDLTRENRKYGDILVGDFSDSYENLTQKGLLALRWIETNCRLENIAYVYKTDDDVFVNMLGLIQQMKYSTENEEPCHFLCNRFQRVRADRDGKYAITEESFPGEEFPPYCQGIGYLICQRGLPLVWDSTAHDVGCPFRLEDLYLTSVAPRKYLGDAHAQSIVYHRIPHKLCAQKPQNLSEESLYDYVMIHRLPRSVWSMLQRETLAHSKEGDKRHLATERRKELYRVIKTEVKRELALIT